MKTASYNVSLQYKESKTLQYKDSTYMDENIKYKNVHCFPIQLMNLNVHYATI